MRRMVGVLVVLLMATACAGEAVTTEEASRPAPAATTEPAPAITQPPAAQGTEAAAEPVYSSPYCAAVAGYVDADYVVGATEDGDHLALAENVLAFAQAGETVVAVAPEDIATDWQLLTNRIRGISGAIVDSIEAEDPDSLEQRITDFNDAYSAQFPEFEDARQRVRDHSRATCPEVFDEED